ncbi:MAG: DNA-processing protein DprA [Myxococcota bacterium]|nr:DNA-processing protein DprA [Myxococcota bacterium]
MPPYVDDAELRLLIELWLTHKARPSALAQAILCRGSMLALADSDAWRPRPGVAYEARRVLVALRRSALHVVSVLELPEHLRRVPGVPPALFVRGDLELLRKPAIAVVGARRAHRSAEGWARSVAARAAGEGWLVVSGGARGIDTAAHLGALDANGPTLAYLGVAADCIYPRHNARLFLRIVESGGALVSEHLPLARTFKGAHAMRNRFIAAHASHLYIAEADVGSGSLGTAAMATRLGVPIRVSPPGVGIRRGGLELLVAQGAEVV